jgi:NAD(P)-dependent dehydrogenase (short-subunit alcohol dehydrogenase family)
VDVGQPQAAETIKTAVEAQLGAPSILVNNAGVFGPLQPIKDVDPQAWIETMMVNTVAPFVLCHAFVSGMIERGWGRVVNVSSAAALHTPGPLNSAYATSKVALNQMTRHLAAELAGTGVTANVIHPGDVKTEMWAGIRDAAEQVGGGYREWAQWVEETGGDDPEKAADLVLSLMSEASAATNGQFLWIQDSLQTPVSSW